LFVGVSTAPVRNASEIENAITAFAQPGSGLIVLPDSLAVSNRHLIIELAARHRLPVVYPSSNFTTAGGLISYGIDWQETYRQAASYVDRILRGAKQRRRTRQLHRRRRKRTDMGARRRRPTPGPGE